MILPEGYELKSIPDIDDYFWVDGACGHQVAYGKTSEEAINNALDAIQKEITRQQSGSIGYASWLYPDQVFDQKIRSEQILKVNITFPPVDMVLSPNRKNGNKYQVTLKAKKEDRQLGFIETKKAYSDLKLDRNASYCLYIVFHHTNKRHADLDNLLSAAKNRIDGMAFALGIDDKQFARITIENRYGNESKMVAEIRYAADDEVYCQHRTTND
jgi:crossover junction endodeoxyribonuclease RusA